MVLEKTLKSPMTEFTTNKKNKKKKKLKKKKKSLELQRDTTNQS